MINDKELQINNKSYTKKDFAQIYPELLDLVKKLTSRWDPSQSNESDPGVVLLKLGAFIADKNNYNVDKNILECFLPSAVQESSMRKLCEMNGYSPKYYRSAETSLTFVYKGSQDENGVERLLSGDVFTLPAYTTVVTDSENNISYTLKDNVKITTDLIGVEVSGIRAIQGIITPLSVNGLTSIQLTNLDDNNRIYIPNTYVAENGFIVSSVNESDVVLNTFDKVDNLNLIEPGKSVFKFGFDSSRNLPYIEFPSDIASLIGSGLKIQYTVTAGKDGNVSAGTLTKLSTNKIVITDKSKVELNLADCLVISNLRSVINGTDPETIEESYNSFKKTVGTFDTLITCRDYANAIYNMYLESTPRVSNIQVTDRRNDINYADNIVIYDNLGEHKVNVPTITPYDLCLYPLDTIKNNYSEDTYNASFKPSASVDVDVIEHLLDSNELVTISHTYKLMTSTDIYLVKNYYTLDAKISTQQKVNRVEQDEIISNIRLALFKKFNSRMVDYGYEIPYDIILETITTADNRIKNVSLADPKLTTKIMLGDGTEVTYLASEQYIEILAKNILAGNVSLFEFDSQMLFDFDFGQLVHTNSDANTLSSLVFKNLKSISTSALIKAASIQAGYTLNSNEVIQIISPNITTQSTYSFVNYRLEGAASFAKDTDHILTGEEKLILQYKDSSSIDHYIIYTASNVTVDGFVTTESPVIIRPNFLLEAVLPDDATNRKAVLKTIPSLGEKRMYTCTAGQEISKRELVKREISNASLNNEALKCYWKRNNSDNSLFTTTSYQNILLGENEYFVWTNSDYSTLNILGSGTRLSLAKAPQADWVNTKQTLVSLQSINQDGINAFSRLDWISQRLPSDQTLTIQEMKIFSFSEGDNVKIADIVNDADNTFAAIPTGFSYKIKGSAGYTTESVVNGYNWEIRSRLDLNSGPSLPQKLLSNHTVTLYMEDDTEQAITVSSSELNTTPTYLMLSPLTQLAGGLNVDMSVTYINDSGSITTVNDAVAYVYDKKDITLNSNLETRDSDNMYTFKLDDSFPQGGVEFPVSIVKSSDEFAEQLFAIYWDKQTVTALSLSCTDGLTLAEFNSGVEPSTSVSLVSGLNIISIAGTSTALSKLTLSTTDTLLSTTMDSVRVSPLTITSDINSTFNLTSLNKQALKTKLNSLVTDAKVKFYYLCTPTSSLIDELDLSSPEALWNSSNIANKFTLPEIDFKSSSIEIVRSSRK